MARRRASSSRGLRYDRAQLTQIITYGRPGTPMPAWGVAERQGRAAAAEHPGPRQLRREHHHHDATRRRRMAAAETPATRKDARRRRCASSRKDARDRGRPTWPSSAIAASRRRARPTAAGRGHRRAEAETSTPPSSWHEHDAARRPTGRSCSMNNCARCHTRGWSYFDPNDPLANPLPSADGRWRVRPEPHRRRRRPTSSRRRPVRPSCSPGSAIGVAGQPGVRHPRHLVGPHAALRRRAHQDPDRSDHGLRAIAVGADDDVHVTPDARRRGRAEGPVVPDDPRRARRGRRRSCCSAGRSTCCSAPTSAPGSGSSSRSPASSGFMVLLTLAVAAPPRRR